MKIFKLALALLALLVSSSVFAQQVPDFSFKDVNGKQHRFSQYKGKWVIVNYWSTYCGPCISELPALKRIAAQYRGKVEVLGMDAGETPAHQLKQFMRQRGINYTVVPTQDSSMFALGLIYGVPTTFIVSPQGQIVDTHMGVITVQQMQRYVGQPNRPAPRNQQAGSSCNSVTRVC